MPRARLTFLAAAALITGAAPQAAAERLITSLSQHRVMVTSSFTGSEVVLFGGIERENGQLQPHGGYDIADFTSILPEFGVLGDFVELVDQAHARGMRVVADLVMNHTSDAHPAACYLGRLEQLI